AGVVTITGTGGAGKTRLAIEAAVRLADRFPDGTAFAELATTHAGTVELQVAEAVGVGEEPDIPVRETLEAALAERRALLVLDNCEHVVDAVAAWAEGLAARCPQLRVLARSRDPLAVAGEACLPLDPPSGACARSTGRPRVPQRRGAAAGSARRGRVPGAHAR